MVPALIQLKELKLYHTLLCSNLRQKLTFNIWKFEQVHIFLKKHFVEVQSAVCFVRAYEEHANAKRNAFFYGGTFSISFTKPSFFFTFDKPNLKEPSTNYIPI